MLDLLIQKYLHYFGDLDYTNLLIGKNFGSLEDGEVVEIEDFSSEKDEEIYSQLASIGKNGYNLLKETTKLKTYVQMVSNDNY